MSRDVVVARCYPATHGSGALPCATPRLGWPASQHDSLPTTAVSRIADVHLQCMLKFEDVKRCARGKSPLIAPMQGLSNKPLN